MGNILRCFTGDDDGGADDYPYYRPTSRPTHQLQSGTVDQPAAALGDHYPFYRPTSSPSHGLQSGTVDHSAAAFADHYPFYRPTSRPSHGLQSGTVDQPAAALGDHYPFYRPTPRPSHGLQSGTVDQPAAALADDYPFYCPTSRLSHGLQSGTVDQPAAALGDHYPFYRPTSRPSHGLQSGTVDQLAAAFRPRPRPHQQALAPHGVKAATTGVAALARDLLNFGSTSMVPEGLGQNVTSSKKAQVKWYRNILVVYKNTRPPPKTRAEFAQLVATALSRIQRADLEGVLAFYNLPIPSLPAASASPDHHPSSLPEGIQFVLNTLPIKSNYIGDGDGFTAYVDTTNPRESKDVPLEVRALVIARTRARNDRDHQTASTLLRSLDEAGYKMIRISGKEILARKYRIRMRGVDAPELNMPYGKESKNALVKLIGEKSVTIYVYDRDQFGRYVGDIYCDNVFIQEQMLKGGHVWHFKTYDKRPEFAKWERKARATHRGLWATENPEKPWDWRRDQRNARHDTIQVC